MRKKSVIDVDSESDTRREVDEVQPEESILIQSVINYIDKKSVMTDEEEEKPKRTIKEEEEEEEEKPKRTIKEEEEEEEEKPKRTIKEEDEEEEKPKRTIKEEDEEEDVN